VGRLSARASAHAAALALASLAVCACSGRPAPGAEPASAATDWPVVGGDAGHQRWSELADIDRSNAGNLELVWSYRHGDYHDPGPVFQRDRSAKSGTAFEGSPLVVEGRLVFQTPYARTIALDPETGAELWVFDPKQDRNRHYANGYVSRGVAYWRDPAAHGRCASRILLGTSDARLIALDTADGKPCLDFGERGSVDLKRDVGPLTKPEHYKLTSAPVVVGDIVAIGPSLADDRPDQPRGDVRGFDVRTGALRWTFRVIPRPGDPGSETWEAGSLAEAVGANPWAPMTADPERDLLFVPTSTASPDYYGGRRPGDNWFADSIVALRASTGLRVWSRQLIHHDLWDYDVASPPHLLTLVRGGRRIDAVAQLTKTGYVYVFERETGRELFEIVERPVPASDVPGERASPTQPIPVAPPTLLRHERFTEADIWNRDPAHLAACTKLFRSLRYAGMFTPPSFEGTLIYPGTAGGANWSGAAVDPTRGWLFVPINDMAMSVRVERKPVQPAGPGALPPRFVGEMGLFAIQLDSCTAPPWGQLVAVDLNRGAIAWRADTANDDTAPGRVNFGPPLATAGGLVFHAGTEDAVMRVHDSETGEVLARYALPASLHAGPITFRARPGGRQLLVLAAGGHHNIARLSQSSKLGDWILAYALKPTAR
jgi:quinoprotein glucose dehydrogenase